MRVKVCLTCSEIRNIDPDRVVSLCEEHFSLEKGSIQGNVRKREVVYPRYIAIALIKQNTNLTLKRICEYFGNRDHATIINASRVFEGLYVTDKVFRCDYENLNNKLIYKT